jgi:integrase
MKKFGRIAQDFMTERPNMSAATASNLQRLIMAFGPRWMNQITPEMIREYIQKRRQDEAAAATINRELSVLKQVCRRAEERGITHSDASRGVRFEKGVNKRTRWLTTEEEGGLLDACQPWVWRLVAFDLATGLRRGELLALTWLDIDLEARTLIVRRSKSGKPRTLPLSRVAMDILSNIPGVHEGAVFKKNERPINVNELEDAWQWAKEKAGIEDLHLHDLRHTFATRLSQAGKELYAISQLLGHSSIAMTTRYAHHNVESLRRVVDE